MMLYPSDIEIGKYYRKREKPEHYTYDFILVSWERLRYAYHHNNEAYTVEASERALRQWVADIAKDVVPLTLEEATAVRLVKGL